MSPERLPGSRATVTKRLSIGVTGPSAPLALMSGDGEAQALPPYSAHTWQSDVETTHRLIEDEVYEVETLYSRDDFLAKATTYNLWFNAVRKNSYKGDKTLWVIVQERDPNISPDIVALPPFYLD